MRLRIAVIGSADSNRQYTPALVSPQEAKAAARAIGAQLANTGCKLLVFSAKFIEQEVVEGYASSERAGRQSIEVRYAHVQEDSATRFNSHHSKPELFEFKPDRAQDWEHVFYRLLLSQVDGVVLVGGGYSTLIAGIIALSNHVPVLALHGFGGAAAQIWTCLHEAGSLASPEELQDMRAPWPEDPAQQALLSGRWIASLQRQRAARGRMLAREKKRLTLTAALLMLFAWLVPMVVPLLAAPLPSWIYPLLLVLLPAIAGGSGAMTRLLSDSSNPPTGRTVVLGMSVGAVTGLLYTLGQVIGGHLLPGSEPTPTPGQSFGLLGIATLTGFLAGLTLERVLKRLEQAETVQLGVLVEQESPRQPPAGRGPAPAGTPSPAGT